MLKQLLLASAVLISTPALAQTVPGDAQTVPPPADTTAPVPVPVPDPNAGPAPQPVPAPAPAAPVPDPNAQAGPPAPAPAAPAPDPAAQAGAPAAGPPVATAGPAPAPAPAPAAGAQIADVVNAEFATYDKNGNGSLNKTEFSAWMTALRTKADPALKDDAANKSWVAQAFGQADADKSKSVSKDELTNFLAQGPKAS